MKNEKLLNAMGDIQDELILNAAPGRAERKPKKMRKGLAIALAAALVLALTVSVGAATGTFQTLEDLFSPAFRGGVTAPPLDMEIVEKLGHPVGVSATDNGVTVTVDSVIRDRYTCSIIVSIESHSLKINELICNWAELKIGGKDLGSSLGGTTISVPSSDTVQIVLEWDSQEPIPDGDAVLTISEICLNPHRFLREKTIEGKWELEFDLGYEDVSLDLPAGQAVNVEGANVTLNEIFISPMSVRVDYTADLDGLDLEGIVRDDPYEMSLRWCLECLDIVITQNDGTRFFMTEYHLDENEGGHTQSGNGIVEKQEGEWKGFSSMRFDQILPLDEIESITIEGVEIPLT